ncbi:DUF2955 domain-containing protein [Oceanisphaera pacifica]|uniref:DUF2955 domain-containing protein n=1 Tax=Oceanisphaera pacifica TaxID=2818389 RepID=A0ABS3NEM5_9GAMM|nr:DUF2955 domain-containing protein [Oceanisphaera pacifica]MBO1519044.1 DUF2955 domain-containing protein [Oceanisphaera pacifica]
MRIRAVHSNIMPLKARRVFRLALTIALSLMLAYALGVDMPFLAPLFVFILGAAPKPPIALKGLLGLLLVFSLILSIGLLLLPFLMHYPITGLLLVFVGLFVSNFISINLGKAAAATLLTVGITMISAAGTVSFEAARAVIDALLVGVAVGVVCQWLVYPLFPEDEQQASGMPEKKADVVQSNWLALRATLIVFPCYLVLLINPAAFMPIIMKAVMLGQQTSIMNARHAGRELLGSTLMAGLFALLIWFGLSIAPNLWMYFLWMLLAALFISGKFYTVILSQYSPSFWQNVLITMLILLGPAVEDSANGKDVYQAFAVRMGLFIVITLYAWLALWGLEWLRCRTSSSSAESIALRAP